MTDSNKKNDRIKTLKDEQVKKKMEDLKEWSLSSDKKEIFRIIQFDSFGEAISFVNNVAELSEKIKHHPKSITIRFDEVEVHLKTMDTDGLSEKDLDLAEEINFIADWEVYFQNWINSTKVIVTLLVLFAMILLWRYFI